MKSFFQKISFFYVKHIGGYSISEMPWFDAEGTAYFIERIQQSSCYLEYGSGGSTVYASQFCDKVIAVDSDEYFLKAVRRKLQTMGRSANCELIYSDIGRTGPWGVPVKKYSPGNEPKIWRKYSEAPWSTILLSAKFPDTILIDGRFRVVSALQSLRNLPQESVAEILFDDYADRPQYRIVEDYCHLKEMRGRMAILTKNASISKESIDSAIESYWRDWR